MASSVYPASAAERDRWVLRHRPARNSIDPWKPNGSFIEEEPDETGTVAKVATILLANRECPWRCVFCDLWKDTLEETVPDGAIPAQIEFALRQLAIVHLPGEPSRASALGTVSAWHCPSVKLYNSGSFFDVRAIPPADYEAIAARLRGFSRVIVECHPALIREPVVRFRDLLAPRVSPAAGQPLLEVAMGLETAHPDVLEKLNKRITLDGFRKAADFLREHGLPLRVFVLVKPPFLDETEALEWARKSIDFAFDCGAGVVSLIPTRGGNGALEALQREGLFTPPQLATLEAALRYGLECRRGRVFADLWDLERFSDCALCCEPRRARLHRMNLGQRVTDEISCPCHCA